MDTQIKFTLDNECWSCEEGATPISTNDDGSCHLCDGTRRILTSAGDELIEFIARHWDKIQAARERQAGK